MLTGRRDLYVVRIDPWSVLRIAVVIVDLHRPRAACLGREGVEEEVWRKVMREWMEWEEEGMGRRKGWKEEGREGER